MKWRRNRGNRHLKSWVAGVCAFAISASSLSIDSNSTSHISEQARKDSWDYAMARCFRLSRSRTLNIFASTRLLGTVVPLIRSMGFKNRGKRLGRPSEAMNRCTGSSQCKIYMVGDFSVTCKAVTNMLTNLDPVFAAPETLPYLTVSTSIRRFMVFQATKDCSPSGALKILIHEKNFLLLTISRAKLTVLKGYA